ncbi:ABC transporter permease [Micromonospora sp. FIMYZ51]|uniref:ABC transporter permease n=1 Tax=Micromonospora sp. FIMYZ51 TaxID=3051832 RepID=UPI00312026C6
MTAMIKTPDLRRADASGTRTGSLLRRHAETLRLLIPVAALWVVLSILTPTFLTALNVTNILVNAVPLALAAAGLTLVIIAGDLDLSVGSTIALVSTASATLMVTFHIPWPLALLAGLVLGAAVGAFNGLVSTRLNVPSFICTLAMMSAVRGLALVISDGRAVTGLPTGVTDLAATRFIGIPLVLWVPIIVIPALGLFLSRTSAGLNIYAVGGNREAARIAGVPVRRTRLLVLTISGLMAGFAGIVSTARLGVGSPIVAEDLILDAIAAVVIGGTSLFGGIGRMGGTVLGVLLIATIRNGLVLMNVSAFYQRIAIGVVILLAAIVDGLGRKNDD